MGSHCKDTVQGRVPTGVLKNDPIVTYCPAYTEVQKENELILQLDELPTSSRKITREGVSCLVIALSRDCCRTPSLDGTSVRSGLEVGQ